MTQYCLNNDDTLWELSLLHMYRHALEELAAKDAAEKRAEEEAKAARAAAEAAAIAHEKAETELAALTLQEEEQEAAALPARPALGSVSERAATDQEPEGSVHGSSVDVQVRSHVASPVKESVAVLDMRTLHACLQSDSSIPYDESVIGEVRCLQSGMVGN
jgi:hypothetical protein